MKTMQNMFSFCNMWQRYWATGLLALGVLSFGGCVVGPNYHLPPAPTPPTYKEGGDWKAADPSDEKLAGKWWEIFQDPQLNALEEQIDVSNQNLKAAFAQYQQSRAVLRQYRADYYPTVTAAPSAGRTRYSNNRPPQNSSFNGITFNDFVLPLELSYEVDLWGRIRRTVESYRDQAQASAADLAAVNLSMHADLAFDYFAARSLDAEEKLLQDTVVQYENALNLNEALYQGGLVSEVFVQEAKTQLETTRAQAIDVGVARAQFEHAVAVLVGKPPAEFTLPPLPLTAPPPRIPVGLPSALLERRPDIAGAERRMASANAQIGVAKAAYYPSIGLTASGGLESGSLTSLLQGPSGWWSVGASALQTVFDAGRRRAVSDQAIQGYDSSVASYRQTVLSAFQQVEDNLAALRILEEEARVQGAAVQASQSSLDLSLIRYKGGVTSYLEVTTAQSAALGNQVTAVNILGRRLANTVLLIQALGGGWDRSNLPERPECCGKLASNMSPN
ncbi:MAG TPA: efflux transporter outer membrane subunit [Terriglobales bacterium]|nr:efflux transporter outer membrane subunit [Terriglobales bacterium]